MGLPVVEAGLRNVGCIAIVPDIALVSEIVEAGNGEYDCQGCYAPSSHGWHDVWWWDGVGVRFEELVVDSYVHISWDAIVQLKISKHRLGDERS
jgi:hypothetical protein